MMSSLLPDSESSITDTPVLSPQYSVPSTQYSVPSTEIPLGTIRPIPRRPARVPGFKERLILRGSAFLQNLFGCRGTDRFGILMYHRVTDVIHGVPEPTWNVTPRRLEQQLAGLLHRGFEAWPLRNVLELHQAGEPIPRQVFAVTFDDGYECVHTRAWPILQRLQIPATIFLSTAYLDSGEPFPCDDWLAAGSDRVPTQSWRPLTTQQCRQMQASGLIELAAHTHSHDDFRGRPEALRVDFQQNQQELQERFGISHATFAFPYGVVRDGFVGGEMSDVAREAGFLSALSTEPELVSRNQDPFTWGRFPAEQHDTAATLAAKLGGWTCALRGIKQAIQNRAGN